jgi:polyferredoxin
MIKRRWYQIASLLALHSAWGMEAKWICNPVLSCHSCALAWFACPVGVLVHYASYGLFPFVAVGTMLLVGTLVGKLLCGWVCPFGFVQDLLHKIPGRKFHLPAWTNNIKYLVLVFMVVLLPYFLGEATDWIFCRYCPAAALQVTLPNFIASGFQVSSATLIKFGVLGIVVVGAILSSRSFCRVLCPIGALLAPLNYISFWVVKPARSACIACKKCDDVCSTDVAPSARLVKGIPANRALDCIVCHDCKYACEGRQATAAAASETP